MKTFDRDRIEIIKKELEEAVNAVADRHEIKIGITKILYRSDEFTVTMKAHPVDSRGVPTISKYERLRATAWASKMAIPHDPDTGFIGSQYLVEHHKIITVVGFNHRARKYPVIVTFLDKGDTRYRCGCSQFSGCKLLPTTEVTLEKPTRDTLALYLITDMDSEPNESTRMYCNKVAQWFDNAPEFTRDGRELFESMVWNFFEWWKITVVEEDFLKNTVDAIYHDAVEEYAFERAAETLSNIINYGV